MRSCPTRCEWFRGCPNPGLIYYAFSDAWLCGYCIGYTRIGVPRCVFDNSRRGICVDVELQIWFCNRDGRRCEKMIEAPPERLAHSAHRCFQLAVEQDDTGHWYCSNHESTVEHHSTSRSSDLVVPTISPARPDYPSRIPRLSVLERPRLTPSTPNTPLRRRASSPFLVTLPVLPPMPIPIPIPIPLPASIPIQPPHPNGIVTRIANAISSLSSVLVSPELEAMILQRAPSTLQPTIRDMIRMKIQARKNMDIFSKLVDTECSICFETHESMRRLNLCGHMFCEECLTRQVHSRYPSAFNCALCRGVMLDFGTTTRESH